MRLDTSLSMRPEQRMILAPRMIQSMEILQLPIMALQERIEHELEENPVLEQRDQAADDAETLEKVREVQAVFRKMRGYVGVIETLEWVGLGFFLVQLPLSYAWMRLDYRMRFYLVTDRSLRLREGLWTVREMTLTYSNVQNVTIEQGPLQRLLGIADLVVHTAGGGQKGGSGSSDKPSLHEGRLHDVEDAERIRERILAHLKRLRDGGLGDIDEREPRAEGALGPIEAARELLEEARALRAALERSMTP